MKVDADILFRLQALSPQQRGVLTTRDLEVLFMTSNRQLLKNRLRPYLEERILVRFCRGFYLVPKATTPEAGLAALSQRICAHSIISLGTVLARARLIGTIPKNVVYAVKAGTSRTYENKDIGRIVHFGFGGLKESSLVGFGYQFEDGICYAEPERALLDTLYFYQRGNKFFFNIYSDIAVDRIDRDTYLKYVDEYPNSRFRTFARSYLNEEV
jgi:hypothetical protein